eukprot:Mrub_06136.p1 GENE.Mrub_06136~~Mrub_06136.p1  ORF type:complete len:145 (-),score=27.39 Mrub_06136:221-655(-)
MMIGFCFGHQMIAKALGGKVVSKGEFVCKIEDVALKYELWPGSATSVKVLQAHGDEVGQLPSQCVEIGYSHSAKYEILYYPDIILTHQGHPEISNDDAIQNIIPGVQHDVKNIDDSMKSLNNDRPDVGFFVKMHMKFLSGNFLF